MMHYTDRRDDGSRSMFGTSEQELLYINFFTSAKSNAPPPTSKGLLLSFSKSTSAQTIKQYKNNNMTIT